MCVIWALVIVCGGLGLFGLIVTAWPVGLLVTAALLYWLALKIENGWLDTLF